MHGLSQRFPPGFGYLSRLFPPGDGLAQGFRAYFPRLFGRFCRPTGGEDTKRNLMHVKDRAANLADATRQGKPN